MRVIHYIKRITIAATALVCWQNIQAQWTVTEPTEDYQGSVNLPSNYYIQNGAIQLNGASTKNGSFISINPEQYLDGKNILNVGGGRGNRYPLFTMTKDGDFDMSGDFTMGNSYNYPIFSIKRDAADKSNPTTIEAYGENGYTPLNLHAASYNFNDGNVIIEGQLEKVKKIGVGSTTSTDDALISMEAYMTSAEYFILGSHYNATPFYVKTNGEMKTGNLIEMGSTKGGHLLINSYDNFATSFSNVSDGSTYHPMSFYASKYNFNLSAGKDTMHIIGGVLSVDGTITCKDQLKVAEIDADQIKTKDINVEMNQAADYVFDEDYNLQSLNEVEAYVKSNKHLPGVPSASEMATEGMSVSQMSNLLLEKVEVLTLHMIQMQKKMEQLQSENEALRTEMRGLKGE